MPDDPLPRVVGADLNQPPSDVGANSLGISSVATNSVALHSPTTVPLLSSKKPLAGTVPVSSSTTSAVRNLSTSPSQQQPPPQPSSGISDSASLRTTSSRSPLSTIPRPAIDSSSSIATAAANAASAVSSLATPSTTSFATPIPTPCDPTQPPFRKAMTVVLGEADFKDVISEFYLGRWLPSLGLVLTQTQAAVAGVRLPNYVALIAGSSLGVTDEVGTTLTQNSIVDLMEPRGFTWKAYMGGYTGNCSMASTMRGKNAAGSWRTYLRSRNPFLQFPAIFANSTRCANVVGEAALDSDAAAASTGAGTLPDYMFYVPAMEDVAGGNSTLAAAAGWLKAFLEPKLVDPVFAKTLFFLTFDNARLYTTTTTVYGLLVGAGVSKPGVTSATTFKLGSWPATVLRAFQMDAAPLGDGAAASLGTFPLRWNCAPENASTSSPTFLATSSSLLPSSVVITVPVSKQPVSSPGALNSTTRGYDQSASAMTAATVSVHSVGGTGEKGQTAAAFGSSIGSVRSHATRAHDPQVIASPSSVAVFIAAASLKPLSSNAQTSGP
ncbi:hypothetical protein DFJ73DRAFT_773359 [Zopfochytrium polystomum]|nr:hypothetical protein DFJ73DRAFT_773359 [Zopfochytrium polystomum]